MIKNKYLLLFFFSTFLPFYLSTCFIGCGTVPSKRIVSQPAPRPQSAVKKEKVEETVVKETAKPVKTIPVKIVRIGVVTNTLSVSIGCSGVYSVTEPSTGAKYEIADGDVHSAGISKGRIAFSKKTHSNDIRLTPLQPGNYISVDGRKYRGSIILKITPGKRLNIINELELEEYIYGIMAMEVGPSWPEESLKAQAVVARTFTLKNLGRHESAAFNVCDDVHCQAYGGLNAEDPRSNKAVDATKGEVLVYDGVMINTVYHSNCGGHTEDAWNVWDYYKKEKPGYLSGVDCGYCEGDRWYKWDETLSFKYIAGALKKAGYPVGDIESIKTSGKTSSGRVKEVVIKHSKGKKYIPSAKFRMAMSPNTIRSTNFTVKSGKNSAYFRGNGWGHGVGMCQWGAKGMAEKGYDYEEILKHYYKGTKIKLWNELN